VPGGQIVNMDRREYEGERETGERQRARYGVRETEGEIWGFGRQRV